MQSFDKLRIGGLGLWLAMFLFSGLAAIAQTFPPLTGRVVDSANLLDPAQEISLDAKLKALEDQTDRQMVVATIPDLQGYPIEDYGYRLGRQWGIGEKDKNTGTMLIIAPAERKVRIEVGYGLEPILTDALSSVIINTVIVPQFKESDFPGGIAAGADAMIEQLRLPPEQAAKRAQTITTKAQESENIEAIIFVIFIIVFFVLPLIFGRGNRGRRFGAGPVIIWGGGSGGGFGGGGFGGGGFSGGGGSFGGGGASGGW